MNLRMVSLASVTSAAPPPKVPAPKHGEKRCSVVETYQILEIYAVYMCNIMQCVYVYIYICVCVCVNAQYLYTYIHIYT